MEMENVLGLAAGVLTSVSMIPQLITVVREKNAGNLSPFMIGLLLAGVGLWIWYGAVKSDLPVLLTNCFSALVNTGLLACCLLFQRQKRSGKSA